MTFPLYRAVYAYEAEGVEFDNTRNYYPDPAKVVAISPNVFCLRAGVELAAVQRDDDFTFTELTADQRTAALAEQGLPADWAQPPTVNTNPAGV
tara:strand:+ start:2106 stop:2387 length:282 start_codon:yes stop_codon:yes gene_type:complete